MTFLTAVLLTIWLVLLALLICFFSGADIEEED
jgi:hypothetical protein